MSSPRRVSPPRKTQSNDHLDWDLGDIAEELQLIALESLPPGTSLPLHTQSRYLNTVNTSEVELKALGHQVCLSIFIYFLQ